MDYWGTGLLLFAVCTIGFTGFFIASMPNELVNPIQRPSLKSQTYSENWILGSTSDLYHLNKTVTYSGILPNNQFFDFNTASPKINVIFALNFYAHALQGKIIVLKWQTWAGIGFLGSWILTPKYETMTWENSINKWFINLNDIVSNYIPDRNVSYFEKVSSTNPSIRVQFADSNYTRNNIIAAWNDGSFNCMLSFGMDNVTVAVNALTLVGQLLFFQAWSWCDPILMFVIDLPFWTLTIYIAARIIRLFIPFLSGN